jgi:Ca2+/Na+ antiporter
MTDRLIYSESLSSKRTGALFVGLTIIFLLLFVWRVSTRGLDILAVVFISVCGLFLFYTVNYRVLVIHLTSDSLKLTFGIFKWLVPIDNIENCSLDEIPALMRYGGAGIHFMSIRNRYRASFNFLEYPRIVLGLKRKVGSVQDVSFSTRYPDLVLKHIRDAVNVRKGIQDSGIVSSNSTF